MEKLCLLLDKAELKIIALKKTFRYAVMTHD